jgi:hypothetical protein
MTVTNEIGTYSIVPLWVAEALAERKDGRALALYVGLSNWTSGIGGNCWPSRKTLADYLNVSADTVDRWTAALVDIGALTVEHRYTDDGDMSSNLYTVRVVPPGASKDAETPMGNDAETPSRKDAALTSTHLEADPIDPESVAAFSVASPAHQLCTQLADHIEQLGAKRPTITNTWLTDMDRAIRIDKRTPEQLAACIRWLSTPNRDAQFWSTNILSPKKLRANFDKMALQARAAKQPHRAPTPIEQAREMMAQRNAARQRAQGEGMVLGMTHGEQQ